MCFITEGYDRTCHLFPLPEYANTDIYAKCPTWTRNPKLLKGVQLLREKKFNELVELIQVELVLTFSLQDIIDYL